MLLLLLSRPSFQVRATVMAYLHCTSPRAALMPLAFLFLAWIAIGTVWYVVWLGWSVDKAFYFAAQAGFSVGFGALNEVRMSCFSASSFSYLSLSFSSIQTLSLSRLCSLCSLSVFSFSRSCSLALSLSRSLSLSLSNRTWAMVSQMFFSLLSLSCLFLSNLSKLSLLSLYSLLSSLFSRSLSLLSLARTSLLLSRSSL